MGVIIQGNFTSPDGFTYTSFYFRITSISLNISTTSSFVSVNANSYLSREMYKGGSSPLNMALIPLSYGFSIPTSKIDSIPIVSYMYYLVTNSFSSNLSDSNSFQYRPVLESSQTAFQPSGDLIVTSTQLTQVSDADSGRLLASFTSP